MRSILLVTTIVMFISVGTQAAQETPKDLKEMTTAELTERVEALEAEKSELEEEIEDQQIAIIFCISIFIIALLSLVFLSGKRSNTSYPTTRTLGEPQGRVEC